MRLKRKATLAIPTESQNQSETTITEHFLSEMNASFDDYLMPADQVHSDAAIAVPHMSDWPEPDWHIHEDNRMPAKYLTEKTPIKRLSPTKPEPVKFAPKP